MAIGTPVSIGTVQNKTAQSTTVLTTTASVPAGALIVVVVAFDTFYGIVSIADSASNTYTLAEWQQVGGADSGVDSRIYYIENAAALSSGGTITVDWNTEPTAKAISAFYVEGIATSGALDQIGKASGTSTTPSVSTTSATTQADELTVGIVGTEGPSGDSFTQDSSPAYATPPVRVGTSGASAVSNITVAGGSFIETATGTKTYNPTLGTSRDWAAVIATFKGAAADQGDLTASGTGTASLVGASTAASDVSAAGTSAASLVGAATADSDLVAAGTSAVSFDGLAANPADLSAAGTSTVSLAAESTAASDLAAAGAGAASLESASTAASDLAAAGVAVFSGVGASQADADLAAAGTSAVSLDGAGVNEMELGAAGTSAVSLDAQSTAAADLSVAGTSAVALAGASSVAADLAAAGAATVAFEADAEGSDLSVAGTSSVAFLAQSTAAADLAASGAASVAFEALVEVETPQTGTSGGARHYTPIPEPARKKRRAKVQLEPLTDINARVAEAMQADAALSQVEAEIKVLLDIQRRNESLAAIELERLQNEEDAIALLLLAA